MTTNNTTLAAGSDVYGWYREVQRLYSLGLMTQAEINAELAASIVPVADAILVGDEDDSNDECPMAILVEDDCPEAILVDE